MDGQPVYPRQTSTGTYLTQTHKQHDPFPTPGGEGSKTIRAPVRKLLPSLADTSASELTGAGESDGESEVT